MELAAPLTWRPTIGDPTWFGWVTAFAYVLGAALAVRAALVQPEDNPKDWRVIWMMIGTALLLLGLNKQLDLQTLFMEIGRATAQSQGWYESRRVFQFWFVVGFTASAALFAGWFTLRFRAFWMAHRLLITGLMLLVSFVVVRAVSFHHFDVLLHTEVFGIKVHRVLELGGVLLVIIATADELIAGRSPLRFPPPVA